MRIALRYLIASHCNPMALNLGIPGFIVACYKGFVGGLCTILPCSLCTYCISSSATRRAGGYKPLAKSLKNFNQSYKRLNLFWVGTESTRGWAILKFSIQKSNSITSHAVVHLLQSTIVSNSFYCVKCIHHALAILPISHNFWLIFVNQLWANQFAAWLIAKLFYLVHKMLRTCCADFKNYEVADLRLRIQEFRNVVAVAD